ncbi:MAG: fused MFS/spermidine synthase [Pseudomonadota bacterium]
MKRQYNSSLIIFVIFFLSGGSALIYEGIWFHYAGLIVGNSVLAASTVISGFMAGLALGNFLMVRYGSSISRSIETYLILEIIIGCFGIISVILLPAMPSIMAPLFAITAENPLIHNPVRFFTVFIVLLIPTTAMGMTLPLMVKHLTQLHGNFGQNLGRLYGWNTIGAVCGILLSEFFLIEYFGLQRTGYIAALINFILAYVIYSRFKNENLLDQFINNLKRASIEYKLPVVKLLVIAFISGFSLLSLEIIWFRFLLLSISGTSEIFAIMLACVLAGIGR